MKNPAATAIDKLPRQLHSHHASPEKPHNKNNLYKSLPLGPSDWVTGLNKEYISRNRGIPGQDTPSSGSYQIPGVQKLLQQFRPVTIPAILQTRPAMAG